MADIQTQDPKKSPLNRFLLAVVILLGLLIVAALLALVYGAIAQWGKHSTAAPEPAPAVAGSLQHLPPGATIVDMKVDNGHTVLRLKTKVGEEVDIYDTATGKLVARIAPEP